MRGAFFVLAAWAALAWPAAAMDDPEFTWGGFAEGALFSADQDDGVSASPEESGFGVIGEIHGKLRAILDDPPGVEIGLRVSLMGYGENAADLSTLAQPAENSLTLDDAYIYVSTAFGEVQIGERGGAADQMSLYAPSVLRAARVSDSRLYFLEDPTIPGDDDFFRPLPLRTRLDGSQNNFKIAYLSPRLVGFQIGASWMHKPEREPSALWEDDDALNRQSDIFEIAANFGGVVKSVHVAGSLAYLAGTNEMAGPVGDGALYGLQDDIEEYGAGFNAAYDVMEGTLTVGGSYKHSNASRGLVNFGPSFAPVVSDAIDTEMTEAGVKFESGPWTAGASYIEGDTEVLDLAGVDRLRGLDGRAWDVTVAFSVAEGVSLAAGYQNWEYGQAPLLPDFYNGEDSASADVFFISFELIR